MVSDLYLSAGLHESKILIVQAVQLTFSQHIMGYLSLTNGIVLIPLKSFYYSQTLNFAIKVPRNVD